MRVSSLSTEMLRNTTSRDYLIYGLLAGIFAFNGQGFFWIVGVELPAYPFRVLSLLGMSLISTRHAPESGGMIGAAIPIFTAYVSPQLLHTSGFLSRYPLDYSLIIGSILGALFLAITAKYRLTPDLWEGSYEKERLLQESRMFQQQ